jgi:hypothetical protein
MHPFFLINEGTVAVIGMSIALFTAFAMVIGLGAYVVYCDRLNRAGEARLAHATDAEPVTDESPGGASAAPGDGPASRARRRRAEPPGG